MSDLAYLGIVVAGEPALALLDLDGNLDSVITFDFGPDRLGDIFSVRNPDKLLRIREQVRPGRARLVYFRLLVWVSGLFAASPKTP